MKQKAILLCMMLVALCAQADDYFNHNGIRYKIESFVDQELRVTFPSEDDYVTTDLVIPATIKTKQGMVWTVTAIGENAFSKEAYNAYKKLRSVSIPKTVRSIHPNAFRKSKIEELTINNPLDLDYLKYVWEERYIMKKVNLGEFASVASCKNLSLNLDDHAYVASVTLNPANKNLTMENGILYDKAKTQILYVSRDKPFALTIPPTVKKFSTHAFAGSKVTKVVLSSVTQIGVSLFQDCKDLTSVTIPNSVVKIDRDAFYNCSALKEIKLPNGLKEIGGSAFCNTGLESITIPETVETIGSHCFSGCKNLKNVSMLCKVKKLKDNTFYICSKLQKLAISENLQEIGSDVFGLDTLLTMIHCYAQTPKMKFCFFYDYLARFYKPMEIHIPKGHLAAYEASDWKRKNVTLIDDL